MATNSFFQNYNFANEQNLIDDLVVESIQIFGVDTFYVSRQLGAVDQVMNEDRLGIFNRAFQIEVYVKENMGFQGEGDFMSRFGIQIRDQMVFTMAIRSFERHIKSKAPDMIRPKEGDLVYLPMNGKFFEITFVEHESVFYQTGALQVYDLKCELFEFSNERFETGVALIDKHYEGIRTSTVENLEDLMDIDPTAKNIIYEEEGDDFIDFSEFNPFEEEIDYPTDR